MRGHTYEYACICISNEVVYEAKKQKKQPRFILVIFVLVTDSVERRVVDFQSVMHSLHCDVQICVRV